MKKENRLRQRKRLLEAVFCLFEETRLLPDKKDPAKPDEGNTP